MFQIKICGITSVDDARAACDAGAEAIGLNFYPPSPRCIRHELAQDIVAAVGDQVSVVGVFVNTHLSAIKELADSLPLHFLQLHGDEPAESLVDLVPRKVIRAFRVREGDAASIGNYLTNCHRLGAPPVAILVDAYQEGIYGGTGTTVNGSTLRRIGKITKDIYTILAGGLRPETVEQAIRQARPDGVDVAGGVESSPGRKDPRKMQSFVDAAKKAFREVEIEKEK